MPITFAGVDMAVCKGREIKNLENKIDSIAIWFLMAYYSAFKH